MKFWIARRLDFSLELHAEKPTLKFISKLGYIWQSNDFIGFINRDLYPEIIFENSPKEVELKILNNDISNSN